MMDEQIVTAVIRADETKTFTVIEPLYFTCAHVYYSLGSRKNLIQLSLYYYYADRRSKEIEITSVSYYCTAIDVDTGYSVICLLVTVAASVSAAATAQSPSTPTAATTTKAASAATGASGSFFGLVDLFEREYNLTRSTTSKGGVDVPDERE